MEEYLMTARSVTQAQRMMQALSQHGIRAAMGRSPVGLTGSGCGYVLRMQGQRAEEAAAQDHSQHDQQSLRLKRKANVHSHFSLPSFPLGRDGGDATDEPMSRPMI